MTVEILRVFSRGATLELINNTPYYCPLSYTIYLNAQAYAKGNTNVISLLSLSAGMFYCAKIEFENGESLMCEFVTPSESMVLDITDFGAVGDGVTCCTAAIQAAIACAEKGATIYFPKGVYLSYPLFLKSDILIYLEKGAVLLGGQMRENYPVLPGMLETQNGERSFGTWEGNPLECFASLITGINCENITIMGDGEINGNAKTAHWWQNAKKKQIAWRPRTIFLNSCKNVALVGVSVKNSPSWTIHPYYCDNVDIFSLTIKNPSNSPNTDGCNPESCVNVRIIGTHISVGDDCISFKSGKYYMSCNHFKRSEKLIVRNCLMDKGHGAVVLGSEISGGVDGLTVEKCVMSSTDRGLRVKTRRGRGNKSVITNIIFSNIIMKDVKTPFSINMFYFCDPDGHSDYVKSKSILPIDATTPSVGSLYCNNISCTNAEYAGVFLYGLPESPINEVTLENVFLSFNKNAQEGMPAMLDDVLPMKCRAIEALNVNKLILKNVVFENELGDALNLSNVQMLSK